MCSCRGSEPESCDHSACDQLKAFASSCQPDTVNIGERRCPGKQRIKEEKHKRKEDDADAFKKSMRRRLNRTYTCVPRPKQSMQKEWVLVFLMQCLFDLSAEVR